jgi:hypothetical protein
MSLPIISCKYSIENPSPLYILLSLMIYLTSQLLRAGTDVAQQAEQMVTVRKVALSSPVVRKMTTQPSSSPTQGLK